VQDDIGRLHPFLRSSGTTRITSTRRLVIEIKERKFQE
jgi:hypothetical protein